MAAADILVTGQKGYRHHTGEAALRATASAHHTVTASGLDVWVVTTGLARTRALLSDPRLSKDSTTMAAVIQSKLAGAGRREDLSQMYGPSMLNADPPAHTRLRGLVASAFTPARVRILQPWVEQQTKLLVGGLPCGEVDLIKRFAFVLPLAVICELLGVPEDDRERLHEWTTHIVLEDPRFSLPASAAMAAYMENLIDLKRSRPEDDLLSALICPGTDGDELGADELMAMLILLIVGGHETTTSLIGNTVYALLTEPSRWRAVAGNPDLAAAAVNETLRFDPPTRNATHRVTLNDLDVDGTTIPAGEIVLVSLSTAGRDPQVTDHADEFDLYREDPRQHASFGHGIHFCPGTLLARMEAEMAVRHLTGRFPAARLLDPEPARQHSAILGGFAELPVLLA